MNPQPLTDEYDKLNQTLTELLDRKRWAADDGRKLISGVNCVAQSACNEMMNTMLHYKKSDGRMYYHLLQSFHPDENLTPETAHEIAIHFAEENFPGYEVLVATHVDRNHIHSHLVPVFYVAGDLCLFF